MRSGRKVGRAVGLLLLTQVVVALFVTFVLLARVNAPPGFLANAASSAMQIRIAVLLWFVAGGVSLAVAITALPIFRQLSERLAFLYLGLGVAGLATLAAENSVLLVTLSLSQELAKAGSETLQALGSLARSARNATHYINILIGGITAFVFDLIVFRFALIPRALAGVALAVVPLQTTAVTLGLLGYRFQLWMLMPVAVVQLTVVLWLVARGFDERRLVNRLT